MRRTIATALTLAALATPAQAAEYAMSNPWHDRLAAAQSRMEAPLRPEPRSPGLAAALTGGLPLALGVLPDLTLRAANVGSPTLVFGAIGVASLASGYVYAGDPWRGTLVVLGFPVVALVGALLGVGFNQVIGGNGYGSVLYGGVGIGLAAVGYDAWAAIDAYHTAERKNAEGGL